MKRLLVGGAVLALGITGMGLSQAAPAVYKVTGGGQTLLGASGAGNTIAFTAQSQGAEGADAKGQFQYQNRAAGNGNAKETVHGTITCVQVYSYTDDGGTAVLGGVSRDGELFRIDVIDGGEGGDASDMIRISRGAAAQDGGDTGSDTLLCDQEEEQADTALARGNAQVHKAKA